MCSKHPTVAKRNKRLAESQNDSHKLKVISPGESSKQC